MQRFGDELNTPLEERGVAPYQWKLPFIDTAQAQVEQAVDEGTFPTLSRAFQLEFGSQQGFQPLNEIYDAARGIPAKKGDSRERISIEQAKTEFPGLEIAPLFTDTITRGYANYLYQRKAKNQVRDMKAAQGNPAVGFVVGVGASLVDPADLALNLTLSGVGAAKYAHTALKAGRLPSYSAAQRYYRVYQANSILNNGIVSGAVEGFAGAAATEPIYQASKRATEGRVDLAQSAASLALSPLVGGVVGGLSDYLTRTPVAKRKDVPHPSIFDQKDLELRATMNAAEGEPIRAVDSINVPEQRQKLSDAEKQVTSKIEELDNYSGGLKPPLATVTPAVAQAPSPLAATPTVAQAPSPLAATPTVGQVVGPFVLPAGLSRSAPRYGYRDKNFSLQFANDFDRAAYILASDNVAASKAAPKFREALKQYGYDPAEVARYGKTVRAGIKPLAASSEPGTLVLPDFGGLPKKSSKPAVEQAPLAATPAVEQVAGPFVLPAGLSRSAPRYGYRDKNFTLQFATDLDRAAYILASDNVAASKAAPKFREALQKAGYDPAEVARYGKTVRAGIKPLAASSEPGTLVLPDFGGLQRKSSKPAVEQAVKEPVNVAPGFPVAGGKITSGFGKRKRPTAGASVDHKGIDLAAKEGSPIVPHIGGTVVAVKSPKQSGGYGNQIIIQQDDGYLVSYAHNRVNLVKPGQRIKPGTVIAEVGSTGRSTGPHTHIEVTGPDGKLVDPEKYFGNTPKKGKGKKSPQTAPEEIEAPVRPGEVDSVVDAPAVQNFMTPVEQDLNSATVREFPARVDETINRLREDFAEYQALSRRKGYRDEARLEALHEKMAEDWDSFQALVPAAQRMGLPDFDKRSQMISPKNLKRMSKQLSAFTPETVFDSAGQFNEMGVSELRNWYTTKNAELKAAYTKVKNANYRPETIKKNKEIIAELASDVDVAFLRLRQLGVTDIEPDAVSTAAFRSVLAEQNPGIAALLQETDSPIPYYETKRQILENVKERIAAARQMVENAETAPKAKHINSVNFDGYDEAVQRLETDGKITDILAAQQEQLTSIQKDIDQMVQFQLIKESDAEDLRTKLQNDAPTLSDAEIDTAVRQIGIFCQNEKGG